MFKKLLIAVVALGYLGLAGFGLLAWRPAIAPVAQPASGSFASELIAEGEAVKGQVKDTTLDTYTPLRIGNVAELNIEFIDSTEAPVGLGEPATTVVAPAIGNAIFAAVGARLTHLPILPNAVLRAPAQRS